MNYRKIHVLWGKHYNLEKANLRTAKLQQVDCYTTDKYVICQFTQK